MAEGATIAPDRSAQRNGLEARRTDLSGRGSHQFAEVTHMPIISHPLIVTCSQQGDSGGWYSQWVVDSGASQHISPNRAHLTLEPLPVQIKVYLDDTAWIPAVPQGNIRLVLQPGTPHIDLIALFVPILGASHVSVGQLSIVYEVKFTGQTYYISCYNTSLGSPVVLANLEQGLWKLSGRPAGMSSLSNHEYSVLSVARKSLVPSLKRWHQPLEHLNVRSLRLIVGKRDMEDDDMFSVNSSVCVKMKQQRRFERRQVK